MEWRENVFRLQTFIGNVNPTPFSDLHGSSLTASKPALVYPLRNAQIGMVSTAGRECGAKEQTAEHKITSCIIYHHPNRARALSDVKKNQVT